MMTLSPVSHRNVPLAMTLVSISSSSALLFLPYLPKGRIYTGRVWYVTKSSLMGSQLNFFSRAAGCVIGMSYSLSSGVSGLIDYNPEQHMSRKREVFDVLRFHHELTHAHSIRMTTFTQLATLRVYLLS